MMTANASIEETAPPGSIIDSVIEDGLKSVYSLADVCLMCSGYGQVPVSTD